ncbi:MAG: hypothetical protein ACLQVN_14745 [Bryobacteraceae bacterium]
MNTDKENTGLIGLNLIFHVLRGERSSRYEVASAAGKSRHPGERNFAQGWALAGKGTNVHKSAQKRTQGDFTERSHPGEYLSYSQAFTRRSEPSLPARKVTTVLPMSAAFLDAAPQ